VVKSSSSSSSGGSSKLLSSGRSGGVQRLLAVARCCRDCGQRMTPLEDALHSCAAALEWPLPLGGAQEELAGPWPGARSSSTGVCRIVRLGAATLRGAGAASTRLTELWRHIQESDLSHCLPPPNADDVASGAAFLLLGLRGKEVVGLLSAERLGAGHVVQRAGRDSMDALSFSPGSSSTAGNSQGPWDLEPTTPSPGKKRKDSARDKDAKIGLDGEGSASLGQASFPLGIAVVWVRRSERRRGLATSMVEAARHLAAGAAPGCKRAAELTWAAAPKVATALPVAFSQPTDLGMAFASSYTTSFVQAAAEAPGVLVYTPTW